MNIIPLLGGVRATVFAGAAVVALAFGGLQTLRLEHAQGKLTKATTKHKELVHNLLLRSLTDSSQISKTYAEDLKAAEDKHDVVVAELRTAKRQLRDHWTCARTDPAGAKEDAELRIEDSGDLVQVGADADAQVKGLQEVNERLERTIQELIRSR